jgi:hypothetical protein
VRSAIIGNKTTTYIGDLSLCFGLSYFEWVSSTSNMNVKDRFYYAGGTRVAVRTGSSTLNFLLGDHLGSTALTTDSSGAKTAEVRYMPWGTTRYTSGTTPTTFLFTSETVQTLRAGSGWPCAWTRTG